MRWSMFYDWWVDVPSVESEDNNLSSLSLSLIESLIFVLAGDVEASIVLNFGLFDVVLVYIMEHTEFGLYFGFTPNNNMIKKYKK